MASFVVVCPHCEQHVIIEQINCAIFRHGSFKHNGEQIPPHSSKEVCDSLIAEGLINGCGGPFKVVLQEVNGTNEYVAIPCDYV